MSSSPSSTKRSLKPSPANSTAKSAIAPAPAPAPAPASSSTLTAAAEASIGVFAPPGLASPTNPRKRRASGEPGASNTVTAPAGSSAQATSSAASYGGQAVASSSSALPDSDVILLPPVKKGRTNTPWTPAEEHRLKQLRDAGHSWSEIAKTFPARTEGSVKKHWYKDMHYAEFAEDESAALLAAIKEYEASKWKVIGQKVGKPAKACEQYAKEHFGGKV